MTDYCVNCEKRGELISAENHHSIICGGCGEHVRICPCVWDWPNDCNQHADDTVYVGETAEDRAAAWAGSHGR